MRVRPRRHHGRDRGRGRGAGTDAPPTDRRLQNDVPPEVSEVQRVSVAFFFFFVFFFKALVKNMYRNEQGVNLA